MAARLTTSLLLLMAILGLLLNVAVHAAAWCRVDLQTVWSWGWVLPVTTIVSFIAALAAEGVFGQNADKKKDLFGSAPTWMQAGAFVLFVYAMLNMAVFAITFTGERVEREPEGGYAVWHKKSFVRTGTADEFRADRARHARVVTGHLMAFSGVAVASLVSAHRRVPPIPPGKPLHPQIETG